MSPRRPRTRRAAAGRTARLEDRPALGAVVVPVHRCEPIEIEAPENAALDRIEREIESVIAAGGEAALMARLRRLLPALKQGETNARGL
jgi:hypothetical protein